MKDDKLGDDQFYASYNDIENHLDKNLSDVLKTTNEYAIPFEYQDTIIKLSKEYFIFNLTVNGTVGGRVVSSILDTFNVTYDKDIVNNYNFLIVFVQKGLDLAQALGLKNIHKLQHENNYTYICY